MNNTEKEREALRAILEVEREHIFGAKTGSDSARRTELQKVLDRVFGELRETNKSKPRRKTVR